MTVVDLTVQLSVLCAVLGQTVLTSRSDMRLLNCVACRSSPRLSDTLFNLKWIFIIISRVYYLHLRMYFLKGQFRLFMCLAERVLLWELIKRLDLYRNCGKRLLFSMCLLEITWVLFVGVFLLSGSLRFLVGDI